MRIRIEAELTRTNGKLSFPSNRGRSVARTTKKAKKVYKDPRSIDRENRYDVRYNRYQNRWKQGQISPTPKKAKKYTTLCRRLEPIPVKKITLTYCRTSGRRKRIGLTKSPETFDIGRRITENNNQISPRCQSLRFVDVDGDTRKRSNRVEKRGRKKRFIERNPVDFWNSLRRIGRLPLSPVESTGEVRTIEPLRRNRISIEVVPSMGSGSLRDPKAITSLRWASLRAGSRSLRRLLSRGKKGPREGGAPLWISLADATQKATL